MLFGSLVTLFITILIGAISIYLAFYFNKKPKLKYYQIEPGSIFSKSINEIPNLKILYNDIEVNDEIILLRILIHNDGGTDIDKNMIHEPLNIQFKEPIELLDVSIEENEKISMQIINNGIYLKWDLLKKKEYFIIKAVLKYQRINKEILGDALLNQYTVISSRITNLDKVKKYSYEDIISNKLRKKRLIFNGIMLIFFFLIVGLFVFGINNTYFLRYTGSLFNSNMYSVRPTDIDKLKLSSEDQEISINVSEYNQIEKINEILIIKDTNLSLNISISIICILSLLYVLTSFIIDLRRYFKIKKIRSYLKISS